MAVEAGVSIVLTKLVSQLAWVGLREYDGLEWRGRVTLSRCRDLCSAIEARVIMVQGEEASWTLMVSEYVKGVVCWEGHRR